MDSKRQERQREGREKADRDREKAERDKRQRQADAGHSRDRQIGRQTEHTEHPDLYPLLHIPPSILFYSCPHLPPFLLIKPAPNQTHPHQCHIHSLVLSPSPSFIPSPPIHLPSNPHHHKWDYLILKSDQSHTTNPVQLPPSTQSHPKAHTQTHRLFPSPLPPHLTH